MDQKPILDSYPTILIIGDHQQKFNKKWFQMFPFLEYSIYQKIKYFVLHVENSRVD